MTLETGIGQKMEMQIVLVSLNILFKGQKISEAIFRGFNSTKKKTNENFGLILP